MTLPLLPAFAGRQSGRWAAGALLALLAFGHLNQPARADDASAYSATVSVDATADNVIKAREAARLDGQRRALAAVVDHLSGGSAAKLSKLSDQAITDLVTSFQVANEHMSAVRYLAQYTFNFQPNGVRHVMASAGIALADHSAGNPGATAPPGPGPGAGPPTALAKSVVIVPLFESGGHASLWDDPNPWRDAWERIPLASGPVHVVVPLGDAGDMAGVDAAKAQAGDAAGLAAVAHHNGGDAAAVAMATLQGPVDNPTGVDVTVRDYRAGQLLATHGDAVTAKPGESGTDLLERAASVVIADIEDGWKKPQIANYDQQGSLTAVLPITSLDDWLHARNRIATLPAVRNIALLALSRQEATIEIDYLGSIDQLKTALAQARLDLVRGDPTWRLARGGGSGGTP